MNNFVKLAKVLNIPDKYNMTNLSYFKIFSHIRYIEMLWYLYEQAHDQNMKVFIEMENSIHRIKL